MIQHRFCWPLLLVVSFIAAGRVPVATSPKPEPYERDEERQRFFMEPRLYPSGFVPRDARHRALTEAIERDRTMKATAVAATAAVAWRPIGPAPVTVDWQNWKVSNGRVLVVAVSPADPNLVLVGAAEGGIWRSVDGGSTFVPVSDSQSDLSIGAIAFAPSDPQIVYAGMGGDYLGTGVLRSTDAGQTWNRVSGNGFALRSTTAAMVVDAGNPNRVVMAQWTQLLPSGVVRASALMLSEDGGTNWRTVLNGLSSSVVAVPNSGSLLASATFISPQGLYRSTDGGRTWLPLYAGPFDPQTFVTGQVAVSSGSPNVIYWWVRGPVNGVSQRRLFVSTDGGASWSDRSSALPAVDAIYLRVSPVNSQTLFLGTTDLYRSDDGGTTWSNVTLGYTPAFSPRDSLAHVDQRGFAFAGSDGNRIFLGNDGGIYRSDDGARSFTCLSANIGSLVELYGIVPSPAASSLVLGAAQDNGLVARENGGNSWREMITGDYGTVVFDPNDPSRFLTNYTHGTIFRFKNNNVYEMQPAKNATFGESETTPRIGFLAPMTSDWRGAVYFGTWRLWTTTNFGDTWTLTSPTDLTKGIDANGNADTLKVIAVAPGDSNVIYTGSSFGNVMRSTDKGLTWTNVTATLPNRAVTAIAPVGDGRIAYLALSGFGTPHIYRTDDFGRFWAIAGSPNSGLPDLPVNALDISAADPSVVYAGTDIGVFRGDSGGLIWSYANSGMPPVVVTSFGRMADGTLLAGTYGRGAYALDSTAPPPKRHRPVKH